MKSKRGIATGLCLLLVTTHGTKQAFTTEVTVKVRARYHAREYYSVDDIAGSVTT